MHARTTFSRPIQTRLADEVWWFNPADTTFATALTLLVLSGAFAGPRVERRGPRVAATAAALLFGSGLVLGGAGPTPRPSLLVFPGMSVVG